VDQQHAGGMPKAKLRAKAIRETPALLVNRKLAKTVSSSVPCAVVKDPRSSLVRTRRSRGPAPSGPSGFDTIQGSPPRANSRRPRRSSSAPRRAATSRQRAARASARSLGEEGAELAARAAAHAVDEENRRGAQALEISDELEVERGFARDGERREGAPVRGWGGRAGRRR
jgi:hypothetical protein